MRHLKYSKRMASGTICMALTALLMAGCQTSKDQCCATYADPAATTIATTASTTVATKPTPAAAPSTAAKAQPAPAAKVEAPVAAFKPIRIKTGVSTPFTDSSGNVWLPDQGFADGDTIERPELKIENTKDPGIYWAERYSMSRFSQALPNGKYVVKLHFAETFEGISGKGERVFSFNVEGQEFKDFDVSAKAGGVLRAYVETVNVEIKDGTLDITFTTNIENPEINGIEILPAP